jgi:hypothetical protein
MLVAKMCSRGLAGREMYATCFPAVSGSVASYRLTMWSAGRVLPAGRFQCGVVTTRVQPGTAWLLYQSATVSVDVDVLPSAYVIVTGSLCVPFVPTVSNESPVPLPCRLMS